MEYLVRTWHTLTRTGDIAVRFVGEHLATGGGKWLAGRELNRWYEFALYRTRGGTVLLHCHYQTMWEGECDEEDVLRVDDLKSVVRVALAWAESHGLPIPPNPDDQSRWNRVQAQARHAVSELLAGLGDTAPVEEVE